MSHDYQAVWIHVESGMLLPQKTIGGADVVKGSGPSAAGVADPSVLDVEGCHACCAQRLTEVPGVREVIHGAPIASVDVQYNGVRSRRWRQTELEKLIGVGAVSNA